MAEVYLTKNVWHIKKSRVDERPLIDESSVSFNKT